MRVFLTCGILCTSLLAGPALADVMVEDIYVRAVPPGQTNSAAFMVIHNDADDAVGLIGAGSSSAEVVELHTHSMQDDVMKMRQIDRIDVPAHGDHRLEPGADHLMLINLRQPLTEGDSIDMNLEFSDGQRLEVKVPVKSVMATMNGKENGHHHHSE